MSIHRKGFLLSGAAALAGAALPSAARAQFRPYAQQLTLAVNVPLSGDRGAAGREIASGVQAAVDEANRFTGTYATAYSMRTFDDMDALAQAMVNVQFASADSTVLAVIGGFDGSLLTASLPTYANQQMPLLVPGSTADGVTAQGYRNVWRLPTKDTTEGQLHALFVARRMKPKFALAVTQDGDYGPEVAHAFVDQLKNVKMNADGFEFAFDKPDYAAAAKRIAEKKPDYVVLCGTSDAMGPLVPALRGAGYTGKIGATQGFYNQLTLAKYADAFDGGYISTSFPPLDRAPDVLNALTDFRARYAVTSLSAFAYAAAQIVIAASKRTGANNRLTTMTALQTPSSYNTIVGSFAFTPTGDPVDPNLYFYQITDGKFKYAAPYHPTSFVL
ncbi:MAG TPA: branched-chain amino acid ABC transporter substrate-binding protein [Candidatus Baltobacteraceae bacterium]|nr:branched-chain amino acid ABC transporter substrate-binding protein [Candidatus Baltobacteraceae bacterium]